MAQGVHRAVGLRGCREVEGYLVLFLIVRRLNQERITGTVHEHATLRIIGVHVKQLINKNTRKETNIRSKIKKEISKLSQTREKTQSKKMHCCPAALGAHNPFLSCCTGCRIPDSFGRSSAPLTIRLTKAINNNSIFTSGNVLVVHPVQSVALQEPASINAGGLPTWGTPTITVPPGWSNVSNSILQYRMVCGGVRITAEQAITTAAGHLSIVSFPTDFGDDVYGNVASYPTGETAYTQYSVYTRRPISSLAQKPLIVPFRRVDQSSFQFKNYSFPEAKEDVPIGWDALALRVDGAAGGAGAAVLTVEIIYHLEVIFKPSTAFYTYDQMPMPYDSSAITQIAHASASAPLAIDEPPNEAKGVKSIMDTIKDWASYIFQPEVISTASEIYSIGSTLASAFPFFV